MVRSSRPSNCHAPLIHLLLGYIGSHVVDQTLKAGLRVRAAVRSAEKGQHLKTYFEKAHPGKVDYVLVEDMAKDDAYVEAVKGKSAFVSR